MGLKLKPATNKAAESISAADKAGIWLDSGKVYDADGKEPADLDACRGYEIEGLGYHYHANEAGKNQILGCFTAETGCTVKGDETSCVITGRHPPPPGGAGGPRPDGPKPE